MNATCTAEKNNTRLLHLIPQAIVVLLHERIYCVVESSEPVVRVYLPYTFMVITTVSNTS